MIDYNKIQEESQNQANAITSGKTRDRDERFINMNETNIIQFKIVPDLSQGVDHFRPFVPYGTYNFGGISGYGGVVSATHPVKELRREKNVVIEKQMELWKVDAEKARKLFPQERAMFNIYVIKDEKHSENEGTFKVIATGYKPQRKDKDGNLLVKTGSPFRKFYEGLTTKDPNDEFAKEAYSLQDVLSMNPDTDLVIQMTISKPSNKNEAPTYKFAEKFSTKKGRFGKSSEAELVEFFQENTHNLLEMVEEPKSDEELIDLINKNVLGVSTSNDSVAVPDMDDDLQDEEEDEIPMNFDKKGETSDDGDGEMNEEELDAFLNSED